MAVVARYLLDGREVRLRVVHGPHVDWLTAETLALLFGTASEVSPRASGSAFRLQGRALARSRREELPTEGVVRGGVPVPTGGEPLVFLADHPVTSGYPVAAVVLDDDVELAA